MRHSKEVSLPAKRCNPYILVATSGFPRIGANQASCALCCQSPLKRYALIATWPAHDPNLHLHQNILAMIRIVIVSLLLVARITRGTRPQGNRAALIRPHLLGVNHGIRIQRFME